MLVLVSAIKWYTGSMNFRSESTLREFVIIIHPPLFLAQVNLPAHLVVIKSTMHYIAGMFQECSESQVLQMIGRAGRPQFDTTATAVIMTRNSTKVSGNALSSC